MAWSFKLGLDYDGDGDFFSFPDDNRTGTVMSISLKNGMGSAYHHVADASQCMVVVSNSSADFSGVPGNHSVWSPENPNGFNQLITRVSRMQVVANDGSTDHVLWTGYIDRVEPTFGMTRDQTATIYGYGIMNFLRDSEVFLPMFTDVTADEVIRAIIQDVAVPPSVYGWVLGVPGDSELGESTTLNDASAGYDLDTGTVTLAYVGDTWSEGVNALRAIGDVVKPEYGRFYVDREGDVVFRNRHWLQEITTVSVNVTAVHELEYQYGGPDTKTIVRGRVKPRSISASNNVLLWALEDDEDKVTVRPGSTRTIRARYSEQDSDARVAGQDIQTPTVGGGTFQYTPADQPVSITVTESSTSASIEIENGGTEEITIQTLEIYGQKITSYNDVQLEVSDQEAITTSGRRVLNVDLGALDDAEAGEYILDYELARRKDERGCVKSITVKVDDNRWPAATYMGYGIGTRINVTDTKLYHNADYFIVGEEHTINQGQKEYIVKWILEPADDFQVWLLGTSGRSELGETTKLGF